jgi:hypothetical protein
MATWQELMKYFNGSLTAGELVVRINRKHVSVGKMRNGVFAWTPAGMELANTVVIPRGIPATSPSAPAKGGRRTLRLPKTEVKPNAEADDSKL